MINWKDFFKFSPRDPKLVTWKRRLYLTLFACLGVMVAYFIYVLSTVATIFLLLLDFKQYSLGLPWAVWQIIGKFWLGLALILGGLVGVMLGKYWWRFIYIDKRLGGQRCR